jgi:hypothetical protein
VALLCHEDAGGGAGARGSGRALQLARGDEELGDLVLAAASLGMTLVFLAPAATAGATGPADGPPADDPPGAGRPPIMVIAAHITAACATILLATLAAIGSG